MIEYGVHDIYPLCVVFYLPRQISYLHQKGPIALSVSSEIHRDTQYLMLIARFVHSVVCDKLCLNDEHVYYVLLHSFQNKLEGCRASPGLCVEVSIGAMI